MKCITVVVAFTSRDCIAVGFIFFEMFVAGCNRDLRFPKIFNMPDTYVFALKVFQFVRKV